MARMKIAVLISGRGSNLQALIDAEAAAKDDCPWETVLVLSNNAEAQGLERARRAGIPTHVVDHRDFEDRATFDAEMTRAIEAAGAELVCLAGFMRLLSDEFVDYWRDRLINIHPSLLPAFKGLDVQQRAIDRGVRFSGCTVHYVRRDMDTGPIIIQAVVPILPDDDAAALAARILIEEHRIYPLAVRWIAEGRARIQQERVRIDGIGGPEGSLVNPANSPETTE